MRHRSPLAVLLALASASAFPACGSSQTSGSSDDSGLPPDDAGPSDRDAAFDAGSSADGGDATIALDAAPGDVADGSDAGRDATGADAEAGSPGSGALDPSFGDGGIVVCPPVTPLPEAGTVGDQVARSVAVSDTGAIVVAGWAAVSSSVGGGNAQVAVWRFLPNGAPDTSFGQGGVFTTGDTSHVPSDDHGWSVCLDSQNRALVGGGSDHDVGSSNFVTDMALWRLTASGNLDTAFGTNGHVLGFLGPSDSGAYESSVAFDVACTSGALVAGNSFYGGPTVWSVTSGGSLDTSGFGAPNGWVGDPASPTGAVSALAVDDAGRSIAVGSVGSGVPAGAVVWRRTPAGALDTTFAGGGRDVLADLDAGADAGPFVSRALTSIAIDSANNLVVSVEQPPGIARMTPQGSLDATFGASGYVALPLPPQVNATSFTASTAGIGLDSKGRILVVGNITSTSGAVSYMTAWRLTGTGALDASFGAGGVIAFTGAVGGTYDLAHGIAVDAEDRPVVVGESMAGGTLAPRSAVVWRLLP